MKDLDDHGRLCEESFGMISGAYLYELHQVSISSGSHWDIKNPETMEIVVTKSNAGYIYQICREVHSGYSVGFNKFQLAKIKAARKEAHKFLHDEANDPSTPIERKIELVKMTSKTGK